MKMLMTRQDHVYATAREGIHCKAGPPDDTIIAFEIQSFERVMRYHYADDFIG